MLFYSFVKDKVTICGVDTQLKPYECLTLGTYLSMWYVLGNYKYAFKVIEMFV